MAKPNPQAAYYASLGRSVAKTARVQKSRASRGRNITTGKPVRPAAPAAQAYVSQGRAVARAAQGQHRAVQAGLPATATRIPKAPSQTPAQLAASRRNQYVSQGKAVEKAAKSQKRQVYAERPLAARRQIVTQAHITAPKDRTAEQNIAMQVHHERHAGDVASIKRIGMTERAADRLGATQRAEHVSQGQAVAKVAKGPKEVKVGQFKVDKALTETDPTKLKAAGFAPDKASKVFQVPLKALKNVPADLAEQAVSTPSTLAKGVVDYAPKLGKAAAGDPRPLVKQIAKDTGKTAQQYADVVKHPFKSIEDRPVTTALMFAPLAKVPGRGLGRGLRLAGKQSLAHDPATLPGTTYQEARPGSRNAVQNIRETRAARKGGKPTPILRKVVNVATLKHPREALNRTASKSAPAAQPGASTVNLDTGRNVGPVRVSTDLQTRVDEHRNLMQHRHGWAEDAVHARAQEKHADLPRKERKAAVAADVEEARAGFHNDDKAHFVREFGSHWYRNPKTGVIIKPKNPAEGSGHIFENKADADKIAERVPFEAKVVDAGHGKWGVVPQVAADRLVTHSKIAKSQAVGAKLLRSTSSSFRGAVLPTSLKWLTGQVVEPGVRAAVEGAGPADWLRTGTVLRRMHETEHGTKVPRGRLIVNRPLKGLRGQAREAAARMMPGGQYSEGSVARKDLGQRQDYTGTWVEPTAKALNKVRDAPGVSHAHHAFRAFSRGVMDDVNGFIERNAQRAMAGQAIRSGPLMERRLNAWTDRAINEAAQGLRGTHAQAQAGREVLRMYGNYHRFSRRTQDAHPQHAVRAVVHEHDAVPGQEPAGASSGQGVAAGRLQPGQRGLAHQEPPLLPRPEPSPRLADGQLRHQGRQGRPGRTFHAVRPGRCHRCGRVAGVAADHGHALQRRRRRLEGRQAQGRQGP